MISLHYTSHTKAYSTIYTACNIVEAIYSFTCRFCAPAHQCYLVSSKVPHVRLGIVGCLWAANTEGVGQIVRSINFQEYIKKLQTIYLMLYKRQIKEQQKSKV